MRRSVPVRTFADWKDPAPGFVEADLVAHGGASVSGSFIQTLVLTDIATGWTECIPIVVREGGLIIEGIARAQTLFPFPLIGVDFDNDSVFMSETVVTWCWRNGPGQVNTVGHTARSLLNRPGFAGGSNP